MAWYEEVGAADISGECSKWSLQFGVQARNGADDRDLSSLLHVMILEFQRMERKLNAQIRSRGE